MTIGLKTSEDLILEAYRTVNLIGDQETLDDNYNQVGLETLNEIMGRDQVAGINVPYYNLLDFNLVPGQETYVFDLQTEDATITTNPIIELEYCNIFLVPYSQQTIPIANRQQYYGTWRTILTAAIPDQVLFTPGLNTSSLSFYPIPGSAYQINAYVKQAPSNIEKNTVMQVPPHMFMYLRLTLAKYLCLRYPAGAWTENHQMELSKLEKQFTKGNMIDLSIAVSPTVSGGTGLGPWPSNSPVY
jgi:hypothetical protein